MTEQQNRKTKYICQLSPEEIEEIKTGDTTIVFEVEGEDVEIYVEQGFAIKTPPIMGDPHIL